MEEWKKCETITLFCWISGSHSGGCEQYCLLGANIMHSDESQLIFQSKNIPSLSGSKSNRNKKPARSEMYRPVRPLSSSVPPCRPRVSLRSI